MTKIGWFCFAESERERKVEKTFEKVFWTGQTLNFKKPDSQYSIDRKNSFDQSKKQFRSIETDRDSLKFLITISIDQKTDSIDQNCKKKWIFVNQQNLMQPLLKALKN